MSENIARYMQSSQETINYTIHLHIEGYFRKYYLDALKHERHDFEYFTTSYFHC
jgi:hypothetical protein